MKRAQNGEDFQKNAKEYVVNMYANKKMLHHKCGCYYGKFLYEYEDFDTFDEALKIFPRVAICQLCFPEQ